MMNILIVDDSVIYRTQTAAALANHAEIKVVGTASNGTIALQKLSHDAVDIVILDIEMPDLNGLEVLKEIRKKSYPVKVIMFSTLTKKGAEVALEALRAGADDIAEKPSASIDQNLSPSDLIGQTLLPKILQFCKKDKKEDKNLNHSGVLKSSERDQLFQDQKKSKVDIETTFTPNIIVIGCSTGGPNALDLIFQKIKAPIKIPIVIVQHMPPVFTDILAQRLQNITGIPTKEGKNGEILEVGRMYVAPGDFHLLLQKKDNQVLVLLNKNSQRNSVRPAVDYLFESAAEIYKDKCLGIVLTGMGEDGLEGAKVIKSFDGHIYIQNQESCVVFGMPGAIYQASLQNKILNLEEISQTIKKFSCP
jgi:two-component system chemotaxis response regulator CheB